ncbi:hypothetical protein [Streptomyces genisteinicus]|uniref:Tat pathway signal sequence domain protein n=1 Tax=Streptomyces genisteinicus TaxID=2768068 RepID=A0A7H0HS61_9ACTN|nr:hypothetical protein [Streptomyces genisteinicus]QNP63377.1 hypothetical protein IAG43_10810 [Streptomyces genisteinicus]
MKTRRFVTAGVMAALLAGGAGTAVALGGDTSATTATQHRTGTPAAAAATGATRLDTVQAEAVAAARAAARGPRVVRPYEPVEIGQGARMGLLPQGRQNYVVAWNDYAGAVERAKGLVGDSIRPNSLSGGVNSDGDDVLFTGAFRTHTVPARITVQVGDGAVRDAGMLKLPGDPGWGTYYLDAAGEGPLVESVRVTAYGPDGAELARLAFDPAPAGGR